MYLRLLAELQSLNLFCPSTLYQYIICELKALTVTIEVLQSIYPSPENIPVGVAAEHGVPSGEGSSIDWRTFRVATASFFLPDHHK